LHAVAIGDPRTRGNEAVQRATLQELARLGGGRFALGTDQRQLEAIYAQLDALEQRDFKTLSYRARHALFHWPLGAALALFLLGQLTAALGVAHAHWRERRATAHGGASNEHRRTASIVASIAGAFHFLRPAWLVLLPLAWLLHHLLARRHSAEHAWRGIIAAHLLPHLVVNRTPGWRQRLAEPRLALTLLLALAGLALAGPSWQREAPPFVEDRAPLVIALDLGPQMNRAEPAPLGPTRLARAQQKVRALLELRRGARTALIVYAGSAHIVLPLTDDTAILASYVAHLRSDLLPAGGKNSPTALALAEQLLASESAPGTVLLISDGIETALPAPVDTAPLRLLWQVRCG
jgi:hypothetical protein